MVGLIRDTRDCPRKTRLDFVDGKAATVASNTGRLMNPPDLETVGAPSHGLFKTNVGMPKYGTNKVE